MTGALFGKCLLGTGLASSIATIVAYCLSLLRPAYRKPLLLGRLGYTITALSALGTFLTLGLLVFTRNYHYEYVFEHTSNDLHGWFRFAATWAGQEGSFLLWATWTSLLGFLVFAKAGKYEARVMPIFVSILGFLCAILLWQSPFHLLTPLSPAELRAHPGFSPYPIDGQGLSPSLVNYWMTIHPPTIFFGFASLAVPFCYAIAALLWKDYDGWMPRVMPYSLLSCATLGLGLFMGGYWAYETLGWHGFWAWDPVENASFFPWLAITALVHGAVVQKSRGGMARTNTFFGIFAFTLFLLGTFLTRSGVLSGTGANGEDLSIHAFDNISKSGFYFMVAMPVLYGGSGLVLWLARVRSMPRRKTTGDTLVSRDFALFLTVLLMGIACVFVTLGTTHPLMDRWLHRPLVVPQSAFYNKGILPLTLLIALTVGCVPWLAWRKTNQETFLKKLTVPWFTMLAFGFFMVWWVLGAERAAQASTVADSVAATETMRAWISPAVQRVCVVSLAALGFFAALSNAMLAYRVFRSKPLAAGGWIAHVGIGVLIIGVIVSNTYERTERFEVVQGEPAHTVFGYGISFERITGKPMAERPLNPEYDRDNAVEVRIAPPGASDASASDASPRTFVASLPWFVPNLNIGNEEKFKKMFWPSIQKSWGHDLYISFADEPRYSFRGGATLKPTESAQVGDYSLFYQEQVGEPGKFMGAIVYLKTPENKVYKVVPAKIIGETKLIDTGVAVPEVRDENGLPSAIYLKQIDPTTKAATFLVSLPGVTGSWSVPLEVTFKPWINLVWAGVLISVAGILLAMVNRALEARKVPDIVVPEEA